LFNRTSIISVRNIGHHVTDSLLRLGYAARFFALTLLNSGTSFLRVRLIIRELYFTGVLSMIIILISGLFVGMVLGYQGYQTLKTYGSESALGVLVALSLVRELGPAAESLRGLSEEPLPPSLEVRVSERLRSPDALRTLASELRAMPSVTGVDYGEQAVERLSSIARAVRWAGWVAFVVLVGATLIIVSATLQLAIYARREEVEIQKLVGATDRFVQAPFLLEGGLQGLAGAALAIVGLIVFRQTLSPQLASLLSFLRLPGSVADARPWMEALQLGLAGAGLGLAGSYLAVHRFLRA